MIKFYRKIRQNLLSEGKNRKYLKYAFGEIVLVVIGILIALSINNMNEIKKNNNTETELLNGILTSLKSDLARTNGIYAGRALVKKRAIDSLLNYLNNEISPSDSLLQETFDRSCFTLSFYYDKGAYESIKTFGLDKIRNNSLRFELVRFYERDLPLIIIFIDKDFNTQSLIRTKLMEEIKTYEYDHDEKANWFLKPQINFATLRNNKAFVKLMAQEIDVADNYIYRLKYGISSYEKVITLIENELSSFKN